MKNIYQRSLTFILGIFILTVGISIAIKSNLGSPPVSSFPYTMTVIAGLEMGLGTILFQSFLVLLQIAILRKDFKWRNLLQVFAGIVFGWMTTFSNYLISFLPTADNYIIRIAMVLVGCFLIALGIALYVPANIMPLPSEGIVKTIAEKTGKPFSTIKILFDCSAVTLSLTLCLIFTQTLGSVGIGTVILAIMVGLMNRQITKLIAKFFKRSSKTAE